MFFTKKKIAKYVEGKISKVSQLAVNNLSSARTSLKLPTGYSYEMVLDFNNLSLEFFDPILTRLEKGVKTKSIVSGMPTQLADNINLPASSKFIKGVLIGQNSNVGSHSSLTKVVVGESCTISSDCSITASLVKGSLSMDDNVKVKEGNTFLGEVSGGHGITISGNNSFNRSCSFGSKATLKAGSIFSQDSSFNTEADITGATFIGSSFIGNHSTINNSIFKKDLSVGAESTIGGNTVFNMAVKLDGIKLKEGVTFCSDDNVFKNCDISGAVKLPARSVLTAGTHYNRFTSGDKSKVFGYIGEGADIKNATVNKATVARGAYISSSIISYSNLDEITIDPASKPSVFNNVTFYSSGGELTILNAVKLRGENKAYCDIKIENEGGVLDIGSIPTPGINNTITINDGTIRAKTKVVINEFEGVIIFNNCEFKGFEVSNLLEHEGFIIKGHSKKLERQKKNVLVIRPSTQTTIEDVMEVNNEPEPILRTEVPSMMEGFSPDIYESQINSGMPGYGGDALHDDLSSIDALKSIDSNSVSQKQLDQINEEVKQKDENSFPQLQPVNEIHEAGMS